MAKKVFTHSFRHSPKMHKIDFTWQLAYNMWEGQHFITWLVCAAHSLSTASLRSKTSSTVNSMNSLDLVKLSA